MSPERWDAHQQPPAVADLPAAVHVGQDERKGFAAKKERQYVGKGWLVQPAALGSGKPRPRIGQVPGELSDRGPVVAIGEAEEGDGL